MNKKEIIKKIISEIRKEAFSKNLIQREDGQGYNEKTFFINVEEILNRNLR